MAEASTARAPWRWTGFGWELLPSVPPAWRGPLAFALRSWLASMLALYVAFFLQLEAPYWAAMSIWMVTQPSPGMAISKSFYRIIGTLVGSVMGVVLIALFSQTPELFIAALACWIGVTTLTSNLLRNFRSYGAVLAGYTAGVIALGAYEHPDHVLIIAFARGSATIIGIASSALVTSLFAPHMAHPKTMARLEAALGWAAKRGAFPWRATNRERVVFGGPLIVELIALDAEIDFAAAESGDFRLHRDTARCLLAHLFGVIAAKRSLDARLMRAGSIRDPVLAGEFEAANTLLNEADELIHQGCADELSERIEALRGRLDALHPEEGVGNDAVTGRIVLDRLNEILRHLAGALADWKGLHGGCVSTDNLRLDFHRDHRAAIINGLRAFLAVGAAGAFWIASSWSSGTGLVIQTGTICSLFSAAPRPDKAGTAFLIGALISLPCAFFCNFFLLENVTGFPLLALVYGLFLVPAALFFLNPKTTPISLSFCVVFIIITRPINPMNYDVVSFWNNAISAIAGVVVGVMAYKLFFPPDPQAARCYVVSRIRRGLENIARYRPIPPFWIWQTRMFDRISRLHDPANLSGTPTDEWLEGGLESLNLGNEVLRLRLLLRDEPVNPHAAGEARAVVDAFARVKTNPALVERTVREMRACLEAWPPADGRDARLTQVRLLGIVQEMEAFFVEQPGFLTP